ncbi:hypothetical protein P872_02485 [Rhodonellum psychrophilum GCM71 = DSM 17998]|uniref:Uncharacterized protein n=1 Tax=Rhodonellum psychrophilum GCM71 = DSM 17998 TaxID=1123057 RepID=U5BSX1_9BACT|nr:hypothetical protein P872_02485 [Rhodonellum psychrophilum GCM71 = DSM 17998]
MLKSGHVLGNNYPVLGQQYTTKLKMRAFFGTKFPLAQVKKT